MNESEIINAFYEDIQSQQEPEFPYPSNTIGWWFDKLPSQIRDQACYNMSSSKRVRRDLRSPCYSLQYAIDSFSWSSTKEGPQYWIDIFKKARDGETIDL